MRRPPPPLRRPNDEEIGAVERQTVGTRMERVRLADGRRAVLKLGGYRRGPVESLLYARLLDPDRDGSPAPIAVGEEWILLEELIDVRSARPEDPAEMARVFGSLAALHARHSRATRDDAVERALAASPFAATGVDAVRRRAEELARIVDRASGDREVWEIGRDHGQAVAALRGWAERLDRDIWSLPNTLLHGDFQRGNWLIEPDGRPRVVDWELAALGPGVLDLQYVVLADRPHAHGPSGSAAEVALDAYRAGLAEVGTVLSRRDLREWVVDAAVWGGMVGAWARLTDYYAEEPVLRSPRDVLLADAAASLTGAAARAGVK